MLQLRLDILVDQYETIKKSNCLNKEVKLIKLQSWIDVVHTKIIESTFQLIDIDRKSV